MRSMGGRSRLRGRRLGGRGSGARGVWVGGSPGERDGNREVYF